MKKKMNNKGFSLVELIVVVAIMAVLIAVLSPTLLRYVEKTRLQKDNSAIGEVAQAIKVALADEKINSATSDGTTITISHNSTTTWASTGGTSLTNELGSVIKQISLTSDTYTGATDHVVLKVVKDTNSVEATGYIDSVKGSATTKTF